MTFLDLFGLSSVSNFKNEYLRDLSLSEDDDEDDELYDRRLLLP
jgi:hypothetical protein